MGLSRNFKYKMQQHGFALNLVLAALVLFSRNNYVKIKLFADMLRMKSMSHTFFSQMQHLYCAPAIEDYWKKMWQKILEVLKDCSELCLWGNGHNGSRGYFRYAGHLCKKKVKKICDTFLWQSVQLYHPINF